MVVKENRGRKRYILFSHSNTSKANIENFIKKEIHLLGGKIRSKLIKLDSKKGIIRIDHTLLTKAREIINNKKTLGIKTIRTSGTLKALEKN